MLKRHLKMQYKKVYYDDESALWAWSCNYFSKKLKSNQMIKNKPTYQKMKKQMSRSEVFYLQYER